MGMPPSTAHGATPWTRRPDGRSATSAPAPAQEACTARTARRSATAWVVTSAPPPATAPPAGPARTARLESSRPHRLPHVRLRQQLGRHHGLPPRHRLGRRWRLLLPRQRPRGPSLEVHVLPRQPARLRWDFLAEFLSSDIK